MPNDHYIPQLLLKHFASTNGEFYVYNKRGDKYYSHKSTEKICAENNFNTIKINRDFPCLEEKAIKQTLEKHNIRISISYEHPLNAIENKNAPIISKIITNNAIMLSMEEKCCLSFFIEQLYKRTPAIRDSMESSVEHLLHVVDDIKQSNPCFGESKEIKNLRNREYRKLQHCTVTTNPNQEIIKSIATMHWILFQAPHNMEFLISDTPLIIHADYEPAGLLSEGIYISFPVSKEFCILLLCPTLLQEISPNYEYIFDESILELIEHNSKDEKCKLLINSLNEKIPIVSENFVHIVNKAQINSFQRVIVSSNDIWLKKQLSLYATSNGSDL